MICPTQPSFWWMVAVTSPNCAPRPGGSSRSQPTAILGPGVCLDVPQVVAQQVVLRLVGLGIGCPGLRRDGVADDRPQLRKQAADLMRQKPACRGRTSKSSIAFEIVGVL